MFFTGIFKKAGNRQQGLSLVEVIIALGILSFAVIGLVSMYPVGLSINSEAEERSKASYLCQEKIEQLRSLDYEDIGIGVIESKQRLSDDGDSYLYNFQRETEAEYMDENLNETGSDTGLKRVSTTVYYINGVTKKEDSLRLTTLISR
jgi:Tfp pilus assembly protein PilV